MFITFLRHATAEDRRLAIPDAERALVDKGEKQVKRVAAFCRDNGLLPEAIYCSPLLRALQTAKILQTQLIACPEPKIVEWLGMYANQAEIIVELAQLAEQDIEDVWLVGHEPDFSAVIGALLQTGHDHFVIKKASLTRLEVDFIGEPSAKLLWSLPCSLMP